MRHTAGSLLAALASETWAILPERLEELQAYLLSLPADQAVTAEAVQARLPAPNLSAGIRAKGVAVLPISGTILHRASFWASFFGLSSTEGIRKAFDAAWNDPAIGTVVLDIDSPGGTVAGLPELAQHIHDAVKAGGSKRLLAVTNPLSASAAYFLASQAHEVISTPSGKTGSIGVFALHLEMSKALERAGYTVTLISAGKYKVEGNPYEPLTKAGRAAAQDTVGDYYEMFVDAVARGRNVDPDQVRNGMGEGRVLTAQRAVAAGLVDRIATLEDVLQELGVSPDAIRNATAESPALEEAATALDWEITAVHDPAEAASLTDALGTITAGRITEPKGDGGPHEPPPTNHTAQRAKEEQVEETAAAAQDKAAQITLVKDTESRERRRAAEISELCALHNVPEKAGEYIAGEQTVAQIGLDLARAARKNGTPLKAPAPQLPQADMSRKELKSYSLGLAVQELLNGKPGLAHEVSEALHKEMPEGFVSQAGSKPGLLLDLRGFRAYNPALRERAALDTGTSTAGAEMVFTEPGAFIELLRNRAACMKMGAQRLPGLVGNVAFPAQSAAGAGSWVGDDPGSDVSDSDLTLTQVTLSPKIYQHPTAYSRLLARQSVQAIQRIVENDILNGHALAIDLAALHGASGGDNPVGVYAISGVNAVAFGGVPTWAKVVEMESAIAADNAPMETLGYIFTPEVAGLLKVTDKGTTYDTGQFIWEGPVWDGLVNGYRAMATNQLSKVLGSGTDEHGAVFAAWSEMLIGEWGTLEIVVDPYTKKKQGLIELTSYQTADVNLRHAVSFCKGTGLTIS